MNKKATITLLIIAAIVLFIVMADRATIFQRGRVLESSRVRSQQMEMNRSEREESTGVELPDQDDPDYQKESRLLEQHMRYQVIMNDIKKQFKPPVRGDAIEIKLNDGSVFKGVIEAFENTSDPNAGLQLRTSPTSNIVLRKNTISMESKVKYYTHDHLLYYTELQMSEEYPDYKTPTAVWASGGQYAAPIYAVGNAVDNNEKVVSGAETVRVAAIQCASVMGETAENLTIITNLIYKAYSKGARIVVMPECAVQGYMDPTIWRSWSKSKTTGPDAVKKIAEPIPGPSTKLLARQAKALKLYVCTSLIEAGTNAYYNSQILIGPDGKIAAHHRKKGMWTPGDSSWCTAGKLPIQVVETEFGRLGLMICYDFHALPPLLAKEKADIVLYSVGWYGPNEENWFSKVFPRKAVIPHGFDIVVANWTSTSRNKTWPGRGHSCVITGKGQVLAMSRAMTGSDVVIADLKIRKQK